MEERSPGRFHPLRARRSSRRRTARQWRCPKLRPRHKALPVARPVRYPFCGTPASPHRVRGRQAPRPRSESLGRRSAPSPRTPGSTARTRLGPCGSLPDRNVHSVEAPRRRLFVTPSAHGTGSCARSWPTALPLSEAGPPARLRRRRGADRLRQTARERRENHEQRRGDERVRECATYLLSRTKPCGACARCASRVQ